MISVQKHDTAEFKRDALGPSSMEVSRDLGVNVSLLGVNVSL